MSRRSPAASYNDSDRNGTADQIADAKPLLDAGTINAREFARLKAKALAEVVGFA